MAGLEASAIARETITGEELLGATVRFNGIWLGQPVDLVVDVERGRVVAIEVLCADDARRFLPLPAARLEAEQVSIASPFALIDANGGAFYRERGRSLRGLRGVSVMREGKRLGTVDDVVLLDDGRIVELVVDGRRVPFDGRLAVRGTAVCPE